MCKDGFIDLPENIKNVVSFAQPKNIPKAMLTDNWSSNRHVVNVK